VYVVNVLTIHSFLVLVTRRLLLVISIRQLLAANSNFLVG